MIDEVLEEGNELLESSETVVEMEVQPAQEISDLPVDAVPDADLSTVAESEENSQFPVSVSDVPGTFASPDDERVQAVVDAVLASDQVSGLIQTFQDTLATVSYAIPSDSGGLDENRETLEVVSVEDVLERMTPQATPGPVQEQTVQSVSGIVRSSPAAVAGGEILVPGEEEITIIEVVQSLLSYFQEDDNDLLTTIRDNTTEIKAKVTEIAENTAARPLMETPFDDYSVTEGLLLLLVLWLEVINPCIKILKGGFSWLMW